MSQQIINIGTVAGDGTGDTLRDSQRKTNENFSEVYTRYAENLGMVTPASTPTGSGINYWDCLVAGTYTNFGGVVLAGNSRGLIFRNSSGVFTLTQQTLDLTSKVNVSDVVNTLVSTETAKPGSANNDRLLNEKIEEKTKNIINAFEGSTYIVDELGNVGMMVTDEGVFSKNINQNTEDIIPLKSVSDNIVAVYNKETYIVDLAGNVGMKVNKEGVFGKNINKNTTDILDVANSVTLLEQGNAGYGDTCKIQENKGTYIFPVSATVTGVNAVSNVNKSEKKWGQKSFEVNFSNSDTVNIAFGQTVSNANNISIWWYLPFKYNQGNIDTINFSLTLAGTVVGTSKLDYIQYNQQSTGWNLQKWLLTEFGSPVNFDGMRMTFAINAAATIVGNYKAQIFIDSIVINQRLKPSIAISYDGVWSESYNSGLFQFHKDNKLSFNITDKELNQSAATDAYYVYVKNLVKDNLACVTVYSESMKDDTLYPTYASKRNLIKSILDTANNKASKKVNTIACSQGVYNEIMINAFKDSGVKIVRGNGNSSVSYIDDFFETGSKGYSNVNTDTRASEDANIASAKTYIDNLINKGSFGCLLTHGVMPLANITQPLLHNSSYVWFEILNYIKTKSDAGLIDVVKFDDIYQASNGTSNN